MGMYDDVEVLLPLPGDPPEGLKFQTKDFSCILGQYQIREDGSIWEEQYKYTEVEPESKWDIGIRQYSTGWKQIFPTKEIRFYDYHEETKTVWEWSAYYVKGELKELHLILPQII